MSAGRGRVAAAALLATTLLFLLPPQAQAHSFEAAELSSPADGEVYDASPEVAGRFVHRDTGIDRVELSIFRDGGPGGDGCTAPSLGSIAGDGQEEVTFGFVLPQLACNGEYVLTAHAVAGEPTLLHSDRPEASVSRRFAMAAPPAQPADLEGDHDEGDREVALEWKANEEADLLGYLVERAVDDGDFEVIADVTEPRYVDDELAEDGGLHLYRVRAVRSGPNADVQAVAGDASDDVEVGVEPAQSPESTGTSAPPPTTPPERGQVNLSGFGNLQQAARQPVRASPPVTIDTGYEETLPFEVPPPEEQEVAAPPTSELAADPGRAVLEFEEEAPELRAVMAPAAGAMALVVCGLQIRYLLRRAASPLG